VGTGSFRCEPSSTIAARRVCSDPAQLCIVRMDRKRVHSDIGTDSQPALKPADVRVAHGRQGDLCPPPMVRTRLANRRLADAAREHVPLLTGLSGGVRTRAAGPDEPLSEVWTRAREPASLDPPSARP
jgi:hypothetical protein